MSTPTYTTEEFCAVLRANPHPQTPTDIFVWADGTMCYREDLKGMTHMSDDYRIIADPTTFANPSERTVYLYMYFWSHFEDCNSDPSSFDPDYTIPLND